MAFRLYLVPAIGSGSSHLDPRRPKYFKDDLNPPEPWAGMDYGFQPVFIVGANLSSSGESFILAQPDVSEFPVDLDTQLSGGDANTAKDMLESFFIAAHWIVANMTWREVARTTLGMFQYFQRLNAVIGNVVLFDGTGNKTLNAQFSQIPPNIQAGIHEAARTLGYNSSFITANTQIRAILKNFADQWGSKPFIFGIVEI